MSLLWIIGLIAAIPAGIILWFFISLAWVARGEPDARCDAEKDGGAR